MLHCALCLLAIALISYLSSLFNNLKPIHIKGSGRPEISSKRGLLSRMLSSGMILSRSDGLAYAYQHIFVSLALVISFFLWSDLMNI